MKITAATNVDRAPVKHEHEGYLRITPVMPLKAALGAGSRVRSFATVMRLA